MWRCHHRTIVSISLNRGFFVPKAARVQRSPHGIYSTPRNGYHRTQASMQETASARTRPQEDIVRGEITTHLGIPTLSYMLKHISEYNVELIARIAGGVELPIPPSADSASPPSRRMRDSLTRVMIPLSVDASARSTYLNTYKALRVGKLFEVDYFHSLWLWRVLW